MNNWLKKQYEAVGDNNIFVTLIRVAQEDDDVRKSLMGILSLPALHRKATLNAMIDEMKMNSAPAEFVAAVECLLNDGIAERAIELLKE